LILAMKREDKAFELYSLLAEISEDDDLSILFLGLAREEEQHKMKIEQTYKSLFDQ
jgi:rubrerythrin